jgi:hypothetical protein
MLAISFEEHAVIDGEKEACCSRAVSVAQADVIFD